MLTTEYINLKVRNGLAGSIFYLLILPIISLQAGELDELESRMDQLLKRLNMTEPANTRRPIPEASRRPLKTGWPIRDHFMSARKPVLAGCVPAWT